MPQETNLKKKIEYSYHPQTENLVMHGPYPVCRVWAYGLIDIERVVGEAGEFVVTRSITRWDVTEASRKRLHRAVTNIVNKGRARIDIFSSDLGIGYEVEL